MSQISFDEFFVSTTGRHPYDYQSRLAGGDRGTDCRSQLISIPTGLGKTAAVVLAWLWNRVSQPGGPACTEWPRRLVYCLPMRTLVEQTEKEVRKWLDAQGLEWDEKPENRKGKVGVHILMGGEESGEWDLYPEENAILIGTQDMLLSRALNRGYGMSRYRWPMHFGLLNNDALWVMDETQLMGVGVETSAQLDGFRNDKKMPTVGMCPTWWMSATLDVARLATVDHPVPSGGWLTQTLSDVERSGGRPHELITAKKFLSLAPHSLSSATKDNYAREFAKIIAHRHLNLLEKPHPSGTLTLVVVNRVSRAREIFESLTMSGKKGKQSAQSLYDAEKIALIHSRFRSVDRDRHTELLFGTGDRIVIATQAVEAGVDVSARLLITELAPWSSLVQRMGRCNRRADITDAEALWVDIQPDAKGELLLPYNKDEIDKARAALSQLSDVSPQLLSGVCVPEEKVIRPVIRRRDLVDLFDTTPDLCGQDLDVSRYIRDGEDSDVQFYWREVGEDGPDEREPDPQRAELCRVSIGDAAKFLGKKPRVWLWNPLEEKWEGASKPRPGAVYLLDVRSGGYSDTIGWTGNPKDKPTPCPQQIGTQETYAGNRLSLNREWQTIAAHTAQVVSETSTLTTVLSISVSDIDALHTAALWHDVGKAHEEFQKMLRDGPHSPGDIHALYAKSKNPPKPPRAKKNWRSLRHELASALAWLLVGPTDEHERDLVAYLIAAHHGKVRLSIRSLPNERAPDGDDRLFARGIWHGDLLPSVPLGEITMPKVTLDLSFMKMGEGQHGSSWLSRTVALRDRIGPFRLAFLETLLRAADARASRG